MAGVRPANPAAVQQLHQIIRSAPAPEEREAVEYVRVIKGFYSHLAVYIVAIAAMAPTNLYMGTDHLWFVWPALGWGLGVASHGLAVFEALSLFGADWEHRQIRKRMQRPQS